MDGNRRYAAKKNLHKLIGHQHGVNSIKFCLECWQADSYDWKNSPHYGLNNSTGWV